MDDTSKLELLKEYALEYYDTSRIYKFVEGGYVCYSLFGTPKGICMYIAEIFVSKKYRGSDTFKKLIKACYEIAELYDVVITYSRTEKGNIYMKNMESMYEKVGLIKISEDKDANYYRRITP